MCGIVGLISKQHAGFFHSHLDIFTEMLVCDSVRGMDSTGVFGVLRNSQVRVVKQAVPTHIFLQDKNFISFADMMIKEMRVVIGHNRKATQGNIKNENAHPFYRDNIILVHNGTLTNHKEIENTEVDSEAIVHGFIEKGVKETLSKLRGAWALVWYDLKEKKLYMTRNDQRPLAIGQNDMYICLASEPRMLHWIANRDNRPHLENIKFLDENVLYSISIGNRIEIESESLIPVNPPRIFPHSVDRETPVVTSVEGKQCSTLLDVYTAGEKVIFVPQDVVVENNARARQKATGYAYLPGRVWASATCYFPDDVTNEEAASICGEGLVTATVKAPSVDMGNKKIHLFLSTPEIEPSLKDWLNGEYLETEVKEICRISKCHKCNGRLYTSQWEFISVKKLEDKNITNYQATCPACIAANYHDMPQERKARLEKLFRVESDSNPAVQN